VFSLKILIHTRQGKCVGIYCEQPAKVLVVEPQDHPRRAVDPSCRAMLVMINPQRSIKLIDGCGTSIDHVLAMAFDEATMDDDLCRVLNVHEIVLGRAWPDIW
jgi:hypothetical protein